MLIALDAPEAADPLVGGAKGAWLARGRRAGLPILPGFVVPAAESRAPLARGAAVLIERGSGRARLTLVDEPLRPELLEALPDAARTLGSRLVARSSSILETGGPWAGAFTSYLDVGPEDLPTAIRGCWASAFTVDALGRAAAEGVDPGSAPMAVVVQPFLDAEAGGSARLEGDEVVVVGVAGPPVAVLQGWEPGVLARIGDDGTVSGDAAVRLLGPDRLVAVADLVRSANAELGVTSVEWAAVKGSVSILQLGRDASRRAPEPRAAPSPVLASPAALALAGLVRAAPGVLGERLVLPWAVGDPALVERLLDDVSAPSRGDQGPPLAGVRFASDALAAQVWDAEPERAHKLAAEALRQLRGDAPEAAIARLAALAPPDPDAARRIVNAVGRLRTALVAAGVVATPHEAWHTDPDDLPEPGRSAWSRPARLGRVGFDRWEPFLTSVAMAAGRPLPGAPASGGIGGGRAAWIGDASEAHRFRARDVVVAARPLPHLAPLLWDAAGLVTLGGGSGAHLFESARALGIPAVAGIGGAADEASLAGAWLAIDGWLGQVWALDADRSRARSL